MHCSMWTSTACARAGDSHTAALSETGFIYGWGTFRNSSGVFAFSADERLAMLPRLMYTPTTAARQAVKIVSGGVLAMHPHPFQSVPVPCW